MQDVVTLYDDLVAIRRAAQVMHENISQASRDDLQVVIERIKAKLKAELMILTEEERFDILYELEADYCGAWGELEALL